MPRGKEANSWKGGERTGSQGYIIIYNPSHPQAKRRYVKRANLVMEKIIGRYLLPEEVVHHKGTHFPIKSSENRQDDSPENLQLFANKAEHMRFHFLYFNPQHQPE